MGRQKWYNLCPTNKKSISRTHTNIQTHTSRHHALTTSAQSLAGRTRIEHTGNLLRVQTKVVQSLSDKQKIYITHSHKHTNTHQQAPHAHNEHTVTRWTDSQRAHRHSQHTLAGRM